MSDESSHELTLHLLDELATTVGSDQRESILRHRERVALLLKVEDEESAAEAVRAQLRDAF